MKRILYIFLFFFCALHAFAQTDEIKTAADKAYAAEQYEAAADKYLQLTKMGENADVFYNLGNCYFRMDDIAHAILWYERALLLSPGDGDIRFNLQFARTKTADKIVPEEDIFFVRWYYSLLNLMSVKAWSWTGIILFALCLTGLGFYFFAQQMRYRKIGFYGAIVLFFVVVLCNVFAFHQRSRQQDRDGVIVMANSVTIKSTPSDNGKDLYVLHAGTSATILDDTMLGWYQIRLSDGKEGWVAAQAIEII